VDLDELRGYVRQCGLDLRLEFVQGPFEETAPDLLGRAGPVLLSHIDCDIQSSVAYAWEVVKPHVHPGGYVVFDDAHASGCLGATEVVEELVIRRDGLNCETNLAALRVSRLACWPGAGGWGRASIQQ